jgi:hypothetical protein
VQVAALETSPGRGRARADRQQPYQKMGTAIAKHVRPPRTARAGGDLHSFRGLRAPARVVPRGNRDRRNTTGQTVGDYLLERLRAWDVRHVFGYPGDGINGILAAWGRADNQPQFTRPSYELMMNCDTLLTVGSNFPYTQFLPEFGQARGVQIDIDGKFIGMRYPYEVNLVGDAAATLRGPDPAPEAAGGPVLARRRLILGVPGEDDHEPPVALRQQPQRLGVHPPLAFEGDQPAVNAL